MLHFMGGSKPLAPLVLCVSRSSLEHVTSLLISYHTLRTAARTIPGTVPKATAVANERRKEVAAGKHGTLAINPN